MLLPLSCLCNRIVRSLACRGVRCVRRVCFLRCRIFTPYLFLDEGRCTEASREQEPTAGSSAGCSIRSVQPPPIVDGVQSRRYRRVRSCDVGYGSAPWAGVLGLADSLFRVGSRSCLYRRFPQAAGSFGLAFAAFRQELPHDRVPFVR